MSDQSVILRGVDAIVYAERHGLTLCKAADPLEGAIEELTPEEAREVALEDASLICVAVPRRAVSISLCPTSLEVGSEGEAYHEGALLEAIEGYVLDHLPGAEIVCLQVGHRQGDEWATVDGDSAAGERLVEEFFNEHGGDEELYETAD